MQEKKKQGNLYNLHRIFLFSLINPRARFQEKPQQTLFFFYFEFTKKCSLSFLEIISNAIIIIIKEVKGNT